MRAPDCVREHRQPRARALRRPPTRNRGALRARRDQVRRDPPTRHRKPAPRRPWRRRGPVVRTVGAHRTGRAWRRFHSARDRDPDRSAGARLRVGRVARHRIGDRPAARVAGGKRERAGSAEGSGTRIGRIRQPSAIRPARRRSLALAGAVDRGRLAAHELRPAAAGQAGIRTRRRLHRTTRAAADPLRPAEARHCFTSSCINGCRRCLAARRPR